MITLHDETTAPESSRAVLTGVKEANGFIPNLFRALANSPSSLNSFMALLGASDGGILSPAERQIVQITTSMENRAGYCVAGHSTFAGAIGMPFETITAICEGRQLADKRYQGLVDFTRVMVRNCGRIMHKDKVALEASGFGAEHIFEIITCTALKTVTNYVTTVFVLDLDAQFQVQTWTPESSAAKAA